MSKGFSKSAEVVFSLRKLHHCLWQSKHNLIYHHKGIPWVTQDVIPYFSAPQWAAIFFAGIFYFNNLTKLSCGEMRQKELKNDL